MYEGKDGHPYCKNDFIATFAPKCYRCKGVIMGKVLKAMGQSWHPHHFSCTKCGDSLVGKKKYGIYKDQPYCPIHTPVGKGDGDGEKDKEKEKGEGEGVKKKPDQLLTQMDTVKPDAKLASISFDPSDPLSAMSEVVESLSVLSTLEPCDYDLKKASLAKAIQANDFDLVRNLFVWVVDNSLGDSESKSAAIQTLWKMGEVESKVFQKCAEHNPLSAFLIPMITSRNMEAIFVAVTFLGKMCSADFPIPEAEFDRLNEEFIQLLLSIIIDYDVEDDGSNENKQCLMVSRAAISCLVGVNSQFSGMDNEVVKQLWKHELCTTIASRILHHFNEGLPDGELKVMVKFFSDVFEGKSGLFFTTDLKVVIEICLRFLQDSPERPVDVTRRTYLDIVELFLRTGVYSQQLGCHRLAELKKVLEELTLPSVVDPYLPSRCNSLLYDNRALFG
eukprot:CAMPEP_0201525046 /NCGR_PEP_ID=MMETSP0161_2-20130828/26523_1 /ASSEMBLY_ACC=CAM_ASM_000251 /TAXON_ID=180227 /ORGANISM="Neoparamoeba aestuarina, Strain SoJaBio B1-5/56/2" /LENGTH=445 /DNA_ID=CAMNT_0047924771 /DNA_START=182 /DNA_END=1519 /DNA_ORIENTATION=+